MKVRLLGQSVRLRLGRSEVAALAGGSAVEAVTDFGPAARFACVVRPQPGGDVVTHAFADGTLSLRVPTTQVAAWAGGDGVGIAAELPLGNGRSLAVRIEKDYACIEATGESQADAFPNPSAACEPAKEHA